MFVPSPPSKGPVASLAAVLLAMAAFSSPSSISSSSWSAVAQDAGNATVDEVVVVDLSPVEDEDILLIGFVTGVDASVCAANSRSFRADIATVCSGGAYGYELAYLMGNVRGNIVVESCPVDDVVTFRTLGGTAGSMPFAAEEIDFLNKIAADIEASPIDDLTEPGSLEALAVTTSRTLAAWPSGQFPVNFTYTSSDVVFETFAVAVPIVPDDTSLAIPTSVVDDDDDTSDTASGVSVSPQLANDDSTPAPGNFVIVPFDQLAPDLANPACTLANIASTDSLRSCSIIIRITCKAPGVSKCSDANTKKGKRPRLYFRVAVENTSSRKNGDFIQLTSNPKAIITWTSDKGATSSTEIGLSTKLNTNTVIAPGFNNAQHSHQFHEMLRPIYKDHILTVSVTATAIFKNGRGTCEASEGLDIHF